MVSLARLRHSRRASVIVVIIVTIAMSASLTTEARAQGEPASDFLKQLRAGNYFDIAIKYLDRLDQYPGVDAELKNAVKLEKAQTFIDAAIASRNGKDRDKYFVDALASLQGFLDKGDHPRVPEARLRLGNLQRFRGLQKLIGDPTPEDKKVARETYLAAAKSFDSIIADLKAKLTAMKGQKIDAKKEPEKAALREQYKFDYLEAQVSAAETRILAAKTHDDPAKSGKALLEESIKRFTEIGEKYGNYPRGAQATLFLGQANELLGQKQKALAFYKEMVDQIDAEPLRDPKYSAAAGLIGIHMKESPPKYQLGIDVGSKFTKGIRPNEKQLPSVQQFRLNLGKAYLAKSNDKATKGNDAKRAKSEGRKLLTDASKVPGPHLTETQSLLEGLGISQDAPELPTAEPPKSLQDAIDKANEVLKITQNLQGAVKALESEKQTDEIKAQIADIEKELASSQSIGVQILRGGLGMINSGTNAELANQSRQFLTYMLYSKKEYRDAAVVGAFLARNSPGTESGLKGGLMALNSMQRILAEMPPENNDGMMAQLEQLGDFLTKTWPDDPEAAKAQGVRISLLLQKDNYDGANALLEKMQVGPEKAKFQRLLGQMLWNRSLELRREDRDTDADAILAGASTTLKSGLDNIGNLVAPEAIVAANVLAKIQMRRGKAGDALKTLDNEKYGPVKLIKIQGAPSKSFAGDLYSNELKTLFAVMVDMEEYDAMLKRATGVMKKLRDAYPGPDGQKRLSQIYVRLANDVGDQLDAAPPAKKRKLTTMFNVLLNNIATTTKDKATLNWVGSTSMKMGEALMEPGQITAPKESQARALIESASKTLEGLRADDARISFQYAKANRLLGNYNTALDELEKILIKSPTMLSAQIEAATNYENWAKVLAKADWSAKSYEKALFGARPGADKKNVIWGWGQISSRISNKKQFRAEFFEARYHIASCRFERGKKLKSEKIVRNALGDIAQVESMFPTLGGPEKRKDFDALMKQIQQYLKEKPTGLKPLPAAAAGP